MTSLAETCVPYLLSRPRIHLPDQKVNGTPKIALVLGVPAKGRCPRAHLPGHTVDPRFSPHFTEERLKLRVAAKVLRKASNA
jgi:hypothetical protein